MMHSNHEPNQFRNGNAAVPAHTNGGTLVPINNGMSEPVIQSAASANAGTSQVEPKALFNAFRRRWFLAVTVGLLCGGTAAAAVYMLVPPNYVAFSDVYINSQPEAVLTQDRTFSADFDTFKKTQMYRALSRFVLDTALNEPVRNPHLKNYGYKTINDLTLIKAQPYPIDWMEMKMTAVGRQEEYFQITMEYSENPEEMAEIVNAVTTVYIRDVANESKTHDQRRIAKLESLSTEYEKEIKKKRDQIAKLGQRLGVNSDEEFTRDIAVEKEIARQMTEQLFQHCMTRRQLQLQNTIKERIGETDTTEDEVPSDLIDRMIDRDPRMVDLMTKAEVIDNKIRLYETTLKDAENNTTLKSARAERESNQKAIEKCRADLRPEIEQQIRDSGNANIDGDVPIPEQIARLDVVIEELEKDLDKRNTDTRSKTVDSFELEQLQKEAAKDEARMDEIEIRIDQLKIELDADDRIKLHQTAEVPRIKDWASLYKKTAVAGMGVFGLFVAAIVWFEFQAKRIDSLTDVTGGLNLRIMGALPQMPRWASKKSTKAKRTAKSAFWHSVLTESIDAARTVLIRDANVESTRLVMVGSAISGEGKTTLSCHLAASLARVGRNTLLVDCDFRKSNVHKVFGVEEHPGLSEVLLGTATLEEAIKQPTDDGPAVLPAGQFNSQLLAALAQDGLGKIFEELKKKYEFIVIDSSPILPVTDSLMVAQHVDAVILSIRRDVSRRPKVAATRDKLAMLGVPLLGAVVIGLDGEAGGYRSGYSNYGYGGRYGYGYQYNRSPEPASSQS